MNEMEQKTSQLEDQQPQEDYGDMDKLEIPYYEKKKGTDLFAQGDFMGAIKAYSKALLGVSFLAKDGKINQPEQFQKFQEEIQVPCNLNLALCYMKLNEFKQAQSFCETALQMRPNNVKGLFRKGICLMRQGEYKQSKETLTRAGEIDPSNDDVIKALQDLDKKIIQQRLKERKMNERMMQGLDYSEITKKNSNSEESDVHIKSTFIQRIKQILCCKRRKQKKM